jgi:hypothetical protein
VDALASYDHVEDAERAAALPVVASPVTSSLILGDDVVVDDGDEEYDDFEEDTSTTGRGGDMPSMSLDVTADVAELSTTRDVLGGFDYVEGVDSGSPSGSMRESRRDALQGFDVVESAAPARDLSPIAIGQRSPRSPAVAVHFVGFDVVERARSPAALAQVASDGGDESDYYADAFEDASGSFDRSSDGGRGGSSAAGPSSGNDDATMEALAAMLSAAIGGEGVESPHGDVAIVDDVVAVDAEKLDALAAYDHVEGLQDEDGKEILSPTAASAPRGLSSTRGGFSDRSEERSMLSTRPAAGGSLGDGARRDDGDDDDDLYDFMNAPLAPSVLASTVVSRIDRTPGPATSPPLSPRTLDNISRGKWEESVVSFASEVLHAARSRLREAFPDTPMPIRSASVASRLRRPAVPLELPLLDVNLYLELESRREQAQGRVEQMQVRNKLVFDAMNEELARIVGADDGGRSSRSFDYQRPVTFTLPEVEARLLAFVRTTARGSGTASAPVTAGAKLAKTNAMILSEIRYDSVLCAVVCALPVSL